VQKLPLECFCIAAEVETYFENNENSLVKSKQTEQQIARHTDCMHSASAIT